MNYTITITGEKHELADGLAILKAMMGDQVGGGHVSAELQPAPPAAPAASTPSAAPAAPAAPVQMEMPAPTAPMAPPAVVPTAPIAPTAPTAPTAPQYQAPPQQPPASAPVQPVPTAAAPTYTMEQLGVAAGPLVDAGRAGELTFWLNQHGAQMLSQLDPKYYGEFATHLRSLGCKI